MTAAAADEDKMRDYLDLGKVCGDRASKIVLKYPDTGRVKPCLLSSYYIHDQTLSIQYRPSFVHRTHLQSFDVLLNNVHMFRTPAQWVVSTHRCV
jgi:hypothetical protein